MSQNGSKRWAELFFVLYTPVWVSLIAGIVVSGVYQWMDAWHYLWVGLLCAAPCVLFPLMCISEADRKLPWHQRFVWRANLWIFIFGFVGNYFWTHYFFNLLGAKYTMPSHRLNDVPLACYLITHAYFTMYFSVTNIIMRRVRTSMEQSPTWVRRSALLVLTLVLSYITAFMETYTIASYPDYSFQNRDLMYTVGSTLYSLYFVVGFPMFLVLDEDAPASTAPSLWSVAKDALAASMAVTILLDAWRLVVGGIVDNIPRCLPWL